MVTIAIILAIISNSLYQYFAHKAIIKTLQKNQDILLARLRLMESDAFYLGLDKVDKQIEECKQVEIHRYILPDEILNKKLEALPGSKVSSGCLTKNAESILDIKESFKNKTEPTEQHIAILNKVSTGNAKIIHSYRKLTNDLKVKKGDWSVSLEFDEQNNPTCYSIFNKDILKQVLYPSEVERFLENKQKEEVKKRDNSVKSVQYYKAKILEFIEIKERTLRSDKDICREIGLSKEYLKIYGEQHSKKIKELHEQCNLKRIEMTRQRFAPKKKEGV